MNELIVQDEQSLNELIKRVRAAQAKFATYTQEQVDKIFLAAATAADKEGQYLQLFPLPSKPCRWNAQVAPYFQHGPTCLSSTSGLLIFACFQNSLGFSE